MVAPHNATSRYDLGSLLKRCVQAVSVKSATVIAPPAKSLNFQSENSDWEPDCSPFLFWSFFLPPKTNMKKRAAAAIITKDIQGTPHI